MDGSLAVNNEISAIISMFELQSDRIVSQASSYRSYSPEAAEHLIQCCEGVYKLTRELIPTVQGLKANRAGHLGASVFQALKSAWKEKDIAVLLGRLDNYRKRVDSILLEILQERLTQFTEAAEYRDARIEQNLEQILFYVNSNNLCRRQLIETAHQVTQTPDTPNDMLLADFSNSLSKVAQHEQEESAKHRMLQSLIFPDMRDRYEGVSKAHQRTFDWVFREPDDDTLRRKWDNFTAWAVSDKKLYWITGKPGAGKSTLVKYISDDWRLLDCLAVWSGAQPLVISKFFFWKSGTPLQMSKIGLLRVLLYEILSELLDKIPHIFPDRYYHELFYGWDIRPWSWSELSSGLKALVDDQTINFFFMIDGLDELDGDHEELASFLEEILHTTDNVKMCLSSRPWLVFEDTFRDQPSLRIENLTLRDITNFTSDKLAEDIMFRQLQTHDPANARALIEQVTANSSGVFLWVMLVVKSLLEGLRDGDTVHDLLLRLNLLPKDLEKLFLQILGGIDSKYFEQAAQIFLTVSHMQSLGPPDLLTLSFLGEDPTPESSRKYEALSPDELCYRAATMCRRLNSRCKGLLEVPNPAHKDPFTRVKYLHRTVKDFLDEDRTQSRLISGLNGPFDPHIAICSSLLYAVKVAAHMRNKKVDQLLKYFLAHCTQMEEQGSENYVPFLHEMDKLVTPLNRYRTNIYGLAHMDVDPYLHASPVFGWPDLQSGLYDLRKRMNQNNGYSILIKSMEDFLLEVGDDDIEAWPERRRLTRFSLRSKRSHFQNKVSSARVWWKSVWHISTRTNRQVGS